MSATTQRFDGTSIEAALSAAAIELGPELEVLDARRVRTGGVMGFFAKERYEVEAKGGVGELPRAPASVDEVLQSLVSGIEAREPVPSFAANLAAATAPAPIAPRPAPIDPWREEVIDLDPVRLPAAPAALPAPVSNPLTPMPVADHGGPERIRRARTGGGEPAWSVENLLALGVPRQICLHLDDIEFVSDLQWTCALDAAIATELPPPVRSADLQTCVMGRGHEAAVTILSAGVAGFPPGVLYLDGRELLATSTELALAVRALLPR